jgi:tight adherence protein B
LFSQAQVAPAPLLETVQKLAAYLQAGIPNAQAHQLLEQELQALSAADQKSLDRFWFTIRQSGGSALAALNRLARVLELQAKNQSALALVFAAPRATAKLVMVLPFIALTLAQLLGLNPIRAIFGSVAGAISLALGVALLWGGKFWSQKLIELSRPMNRDDGALLDCVVVGLDAGLPLQAAQALAIRAAAKLELEAPSDIQLQKLEEARLLANRTGAQISKIIASAADSIRSTSFNLANQQIAKLSINLMVPLGVTVLPAFVLLTVVPISISLLSQNNH